MERTFSEALKNRRTYYSITDQSPIPDQEIECIINLFGRVILLRTECPYDGIQFSIYPCGASSWQVS